METSSSDDDGKFERCCEDLHKEIKELNQKIAEIEKSLSRLWSVYNSNPHHI